MNEPTNDELAVSFRKQIAAGQRAREAKTTQRLERDGRSAAAMDAAEPKAEQGHAGQRPAELANAKEESAQERKQRLLEAFREKAGRDRQAELERGR